jgi:hypothetical protein
VLRLAARLPAVLDEIAIKSRSTRLPWAAQAAEKEARADAAIKAVLDRARELPHAKAAIPTHLLPAALPAHPPAAEVPIRNRMSHSACQIGQTVSYWFQ